MTKLKHKVLSKGSKKLKGVKDSKGMKIKSQPGRRKGKRLQRKKRDPPGVVYLSHIPHGFYEDQIEAYFRQFGNVTAVSVPRSKSGRARGYAFIEYKYPEIAQIAAETMNNYLMCNRLLKAKYIPFEQQKPRFFLVAKAARENHKTAADKAKLAVKRNRKIRNRHLTSGLQVKVAAKLLKKKESLLKRAEQLGLNDDFMVQEDLQPIVEYQKKSEEIKKRKIKKQDLKLGNGEGTDISEQQVSSSESVDDTLSLENDDAPSEDGEGGDFLSESEEEDYKKIISKAKNAAKDILKKATKAQTPKKGLVPENTLLVTEPQRNENNVGNKKIPANGLLESTNISSKIRKRNTPLKIKSPRILLGDSKLNKTTTPKETKLDFNSPNKIVTSLTKRTPSSSKKGNTSIPTPKNRRLNASQVVMEVDNNDEEINFKTPPSVVTKVITGKASAKKTPNEKTSNRPSLTPKKPNSPKKTAKQSPGKVSPSGKKLRHRQLKKMTPQ